jgi:hypothetical protein
VRVKARRFDGGLTTASRPQKFYCEGGPTGDDLYLVKLSMPFATVQLINENDFATRPGVCDLVSPDGMARRGFVDIEPNSKAQLTLVNVGTLPGTAKITCYDPGDGSIILDVPTTLAAVELSTLDQQSPQ